MRWEIIVGLNVRRLRKAAGLTQEELAHGAEIDTRYVGGIERGEEYPSVAVLGRIAGILGVHPARLLDEPIVNRRSSPSES
jgi:transcriptional regulator with XRE-family HTH domain